MIRARVYLFIGRRSERAQEWLCNNDRHILEPTETTLFFRVKKSKCLLCEETVDHDEPVGGIPR